MSERSILVPLDASPLATAVLPYAEALARAVHAPVRLMTAIEPEPDDLLSRLNGPDYLQKARAAASEHLAKVASGLGDHELTVSTVLAAGRPVDVILREADSDRTALIVMATHARGEVERWLVGSVADKVMRMSQHPILLMVPSDIQPAPRPVEIERLLVPLDGSPLGEAALPLVAEVAAAG